jgi:hypothetical protein
VRVAVLRDAISATQAIRHARDTGQRTGAALTQEQVSALCALDSHPALGVITRELWNRDEVVVPAGDRAGAGPRPRLPGRRSPRRRR